MHETCKQHVKETPTPLARKAGVQERFDYEYEKTGLAICLCYQPPLEVWRHVKVTDQHAKQDWAQLIKVLLDVHFPDKNIILVIDNLNTHKPG